jgi:hypothetical protein
MNPKSLGTASNECCAWEEVGGEEQESARDQARRELHMPTHVIRACSPITSPRDTAPLLTWSGSCVGAQGMLNSRNGSKHQHTPRPTTT